MYYFLPSEQQTPLSNHLKILNVLNTGIRPYTRARRVIAYMYTHTFLDQVAFAAPQATLARAVCMQHTCTLYTQQHARVLTGRLNIACSNSNDRVECTAARTKPNHEKLALPPARPTAGRGRGRCEACGGRVDPSGRAQSWRRPRVQLPPVQRRRRRSKLLPSPRQGRSDR